MKRAIFGAIVLSQIAFACSVTSAVIINDPIENDGTWTLQTTDFQYFGAAFGLTPTAGTVMMHMNNGVEAFSGTNSIIYTNTIHPGTYTASLDVGHWDNSPQIAVVGPLGLTASGKLLAAASTFMPTPALGQFETWRFTYRFDANDTNVGAPFGFQISVPYAGLGNNIAFDNLRIDYAPLENVAPTIFYAVEICWETATNRNYQLQWAESIDATNWFNMGEITQGNGSNICVLDSTRNQQKRFYRVLTPP